LLDTLSAHPDRLHLLSETCVTRVVLENNRAIGVEVLARAHVYEADARAERLGDDWRNHLTTIRCKKEVILCGGAFNSPQLLMLSGIGPAEHLREVGIHCQVPLEGVGRNLLDRYEVPLIVTMRDRFKTLDTLQFTSRLPDVGLDHHLQQWINRTGIKDAGAYATNGGLLGIFLRSSREDSVPDLFLLAVAGRFPGYRVGWSRPSELVPGGNDPDRPAAAADHHRTVTWMILKARTRNQGGYVRLRESYPFRRPEIHFQYFSEGAHDLLAIREGVDFVMRILEPGRADGSIQSIERPGLDNFQGNIDDWIRHTAWGHHACGTCRIGATDDDLAVLDHRFRVRGVDGLRIVDASVFPRIPGYFVAANIYMISEKAADVLTEEHLPRDSWRDLDPPVIPSQPEVERRQSYPTDLEQKETELVRMRRVRAGFLTSHVPSAETPDAQPWLLRLPTASTTNDTDGVLPCDTLGLALSGGGIRSASFGLGVLQAMARQNWLPHVDFLSTVSGGGYIGGFLGRFFDQCRKVRPNRNGVSSAQRIVAQALADARSEPIDWLRRHSNYLAPSGSGEGLFNVAAFWRNFLSVQVVLAILFFAIFGLMNVVGYHAGFRETWQPALYGGQIAPITGLLPQGIAIPWAALTELVCWFALLPLAIGYWLVSQDRHESFVVPFLLVLVAIAVVSMAVLRQVLPLAVVTATIMWVVEAWWVIRCTEGQSNPSSRFRLVLARNHLTYRLAFWTSAAVVLVALGIVDRIGQWLAATSFRGELSVSALVARLGVILAPLLALAPILRGMAGFFVTRDAKPQSPLSQLARVPYLVDTLVYLLGTLVPLCIVSFLSHLAYGIGFEYAAGVCATLAAIGICFVLGTRQLLPFVNRSGPLTIYAARLARVFLGAVNPVRHRDRHRDGRDVTHVISGDDAPWDLYQPHEAGGPLHLVNVAVNETVDPASQRGMRDRQAENMSVGPVGLSIARYWHSVWHFPSRSDRTIGLIPLADGTLAHPFLSKNVKVVPTERLNIREWIGISGAAVSPGAGRRTTPALSLLTTLANLRLGYWWDSGLAATERAHLPIRSGLFAIVRRIAGRFLSGQSLLMAELRGRFPGPWHRHFYLSDGGHFENMGVYELLRRRVPFIIAVDAGQDRQHQGTDLGELTRIARIDFGAEIHEVPQSELAQLPIGPTGRLGSIVDLLTTNATGCVKAHATLLRATYPPSQGNEWRGRDRSWILFIKATMTGDEPEDLCKYKRLNLDFPNESTIDQVFDEPQWESYRRLGEHIGEQLLC
jgi:hypothetical protein